MNPKEQPEPEPEPAFQLPPPPPGIEWHRKDGWKAGDLPQGYRPHIIGEVDQEGDEVRKSAGWIRCECLTPIGSRRIDCHRRTTRPLTFSHLGKTWTWHKAGDPCPCDGERKIHVILAAAGIGESAASPASRWRLSFGLCGLHGLSPKGNAAPIGGGPTGETCGTCAHAYCVEYAKRYHKCRLVKATRGPGTDIRLKWAACSRFEKRKDGEA